METNQVGPDAIEQTKAEWGAPAETAQIVYWYESYGYGGSGIAVARVGQEYYTLDLGHCSCFGPLEEPFWQFVGEASKLERFLAYDPVLKGPRRRLDSDYERYERIAHCLGLYM